MTRKPKPWTAQQVARYGTYHAVSSDNIVDLGRRKGMTGTRQEIAKAILDEPGDFEGHAYRYHHNLRYNLDRGSLQ